MKRKQHDPSMTYRISAVRHHLMSLHTKGGHEQSPLDVMLLSMLTGLRIEEVINLRYRDLPSETDQKTGNRKCFRFQVPKTSGGADGK